MKKASVLSLWVLLFSFIVPAINIGKSADDNVLKIVLRQEPVTLDAQRLMIALEGNITANLGSTLVAFDPETGEIVPYLATNWSVSEDGLLWTFHLRDDVLFHDGTPLTAEEYAWTLNRILTLTGPESSVPKTILRNVVKISAVDQYTLQLDLKSPDATLLYGLGYNYLQPLSPKAVESAGDNYGHQPVGVGPFRFKEWVPGEKIVLERNPDFTWGPSFTSGGPAKLDAIEYIIIPNYDLALVELLDGRIDLMQIQHEDARQALDNGSLTLTNIFMSGSGVFLILDITQPPLDDIRVRQALNYAIDREQIVSIVEYGYGKPLYGPVTPNTSGFWPGAEGIGYHYDRAQAAALLNDAGYELNGEGLLAKDGQVLALTLIEVRYAQLPQLPQIMAVLLDLFQQLGIQTQLKSVEPADMLAGLADSENFDMVATAAAWPEATFVLLNCFLSTGQFNFGHVNDPELDQLLVNSLSAVDLETSRQLLWDAQKRIIEQAYSVPLYGLSDLLAINQRIRNYLHTGYGQWLIDTSIED
ncbi:MAG TPA: ABC transporter substrate-binding protein [Aggregatilineaceae bacterium]|nr:ABC transporter substrate-binding protein [Aggregatilineaceae bacterium]